VIPKINLSETKKIIQKMSLQKPDIPFSPVVLKFIEDLSEEIKKNRDSFNFPDLITFSFFCRKGNLEILKKNFLICNNRIGKGLVFHITPTNIPINFAYSLIFSLLAGNNNIIRVPSKNYFQVDLINKCLNKVSKKKIYRYVKDKFYLIRYEKNKEITKAISSKCDVRIIWGGDDTVKSIRSIMLPPKSIDISFPDRYSFCIINSDSFNKMRDFEIKKLAYNFFNDTYLVDQNACSSPHLIVWIGKFKKKNVEMFWQELANYVEEKYKLIESSAFEKYNLLLKNFLYKHNLKLNKKYLNNLYRIELSKIDKDTINLRGKFGLFFEYKANNLQNISKLISKKVQTVTYSGFKKEKLLKFIIDEKLNGIDRFVPIGSALNIGLTWDGFNLINVLSREIEIR